MFVIIIPIEKNPQNHQKILLNFYLFNTECTNRKRTNNNIIIIY